MCRTRSHDDRGGETIQPVESERTIWQITAVIEATEAQKNAALEALARALCPDEGHAAYCPVPWTTLVCRLDDLDPEQKASWQDNFDEDRRRAREAREPGA